MLPAAAVFRHMRQTQVIFSFASADGGLDLAEALRAELLRALGVRQDSMPCPDGLTTMEKRVRPPAQSSVVTAATARVCRDSLKACHGAHSLTRQRFPVPPGV